VAIVKRDAENTARLGSMRVRQASGVGVEIEFQSLFRSLKDKVAGLAFRKVRGDLALDRWCQPSFEIIANQPDSFLAFHKFSLPSNTVCSSQAKRIREAKNSN
jgi:hypothetical protein